MLKFSRFSVTLLLLIVLCAGVFAPQVEDVEAKPDLLPATNVVISEFRTRGASVTNTATDEFIEIYNPTNSAIILTGYKLRRSSSCGATLNDIYTFPALSLQAGQYYLVASQDYSGSITPDITLLTNMSIADTGGIAITDSSNNPIDQVGLCSTTTFKEGTTLTSLSGTANQSYERKIGGTSDSCEDDNDNSLDFQLLNPSAPQNSSTARRLCGVATDLSITKSVDNASQSIGNNVTFTITVSNASGYDDATNVIVKDLLPTGLTYVSHATATGTYVSGTGFWAVGSLTNGTSATLTITATVTSSAVKINSAEVWSADQFDADSTAGNNSTTEDDDASVTVTPTSVPLNITNNVNLPNQSIGSNVVFTINVNNPYNISATGVSVSALLPAGLTYVSHSTTSGTYVSGTGVWTIGTLAANVGSATLTVTARVTTPGSKNYSATVSSNEFLNNTASATVNPPVSSLALTISNTVNNPNPNIGANVVFTITVSNPHTIYASNVNVSALLPAGLTYVSHSTSTGTYTSGTGLWSLGSNLNANGGSATLTVTATVATTGVKNYSATVTSNEFINSIATATVTPIGSTQADLKLLPPSLSQTWRRSTSSADTAILKVTVDNEDVSNSATNVQVKLLLPSGLTYVSHSSGDNYNSNTGIWAVGTVTSSVNAEIEITVKVSASGTSTTYFAEILQSDQFDPDSTPANGDVVEDDSYEDEVLVSDLSLTQTVDIAGSNAVFILRVTNSGPDDANNIKIDNSELDNPLSYTFVSSSSSAYNSLTGEWDIPTLADGATATLIVTTTLVSANENWAEINDVTQVDPDSLPNNCSSACREDDDAAAPSADLSITKIISSPATYQNSEIDSTVTFRITVTNSGFANATGVEVKDLLPTGLTYVSHTSGQTYNKSNGIWSVGNLPKDTSRTLEITAKVTSLGIRTNWAEVWKSNQSDPDSDPGDGSIISDDDASATITSYRSILINEVAWSGTAASVDDEWIELYNPSDSEITITDWTIRKTSCSGAVYITLTGKISRDGYFLLERDDNTTVSDISANQIYTASALNDSGEVLYLCDNSGHFIDSVNQQGSNVSPNSWPAGNTTATRPTMERKNNATETDTSWVTNNGVTKNGLNASGGSIYGTPGKKNSVTSTTTNPTAVPPTATPAPQIPPRPIINEIHARPGFDWNQDGRVDVFDEFIEIKNLTAIDISLKGWKLDKPNSTSFSLPDVTLKPNERIVFYSLETNLLLSDGGETIRLLNPSNTIYDAYTYTVAKTEDQSFCRLPDGNVYNGWFEDCIPTPNENNTRKGSVPTSPSGETESPTCDLPDTIPADFFFAECRGYGANIWNPLYWDDIFRTFIQSNTTKWESYLE